MDVTAVTTLISTVGFPIACVIALCFFIYKIYKRSEEREDKLMGEIAKTREVNARAVEIIANHAGRLEAIQTDITDIKSDIAVIMAKQ